MLVLFLVFSAIGLGFGPQQVRASDGYAPAVTKASATASSLGAVRIAVKLAPGARLAHKPDGSLTVVQEWGSLAEAAVDSPGLQLVESGTVQGLGIRVLEPQSANAGTVAVQALRLMPGVLWAEVSHPVYACLVPNDPLYPPSAWEPAGQWSLPRVGLPEAWDTTTGSADLVVALIDSGLNRDIPDFAGRIVSPYSVLAGSAVWPAWQDTYGHGSGVAGVAVARGNDHLGMAGAAWNVKLMPVKVAESGASDDVTLARGITYAVDNGADVINVSFAGRDTSRTQENAVAYALERNVVIVAAAGNNYGSSVSYPAAIPGVIAVGATDSFNTRCDFSNAGSALDLVAPGAGILSYSSGSSTSFARWSGTSFSAPLVAGVVALLRSANPALTPGEITDILSDSADDLGSTGWDKDFGWGLLDADGAIAEATAAGITTTTAPPSTTTTTAPPSTTTTTAPPSTTTTTAPPSTTTTTAPPSTTTTTAPRFADVTGDTPYASQIDHLAALGIIDGTGDGLFHPLDALRRQQFAKMIVLTLGYPVSENDTSPFVDVDHVPGDLYPYHYVAVAYRRGITEGTKPGYFSPFGPLTRAQMITMVARAAQLQEPPAGYTPPFAAFSTVHYPFARKAASAGLLGGLLGMGPDYSFLAPASRGEACALLYELLQ